MHNAQPTFVTNHAYKLGFRPRSKHADEFHKLSAKLYDLDAKLRYLSFFDPEDE